VASYSVLIEARADGASEIDQAALDAFGVAAQPYQAVITGGAQSWSALISVEATGAADAAALAAALVALVAKESGLPAWPVVRAEAIREDVLVEELARPRFPELVSGPEAAEILDVSVERVHQLAAEHPDFPAPAYKLRAASLWLRADVVSFGERWDRRPDRPRKDPEDA
jgi:hypothetical protein